MDKYTQGWRTRQGSRVQKCRQHIMEDRDLCLTKLLPKEQVKAAKRGLRTREAPVSYRRRIGKSKVSGTVRGTFGAGRKILWVILREARDGR